jgi:hypothetical protein
MVDVVTNHMGYDGCGTCVDYTVDYTVFNPFNSVNTIQCRRICIPKLCY